VFIYKNLKKENDVQQTELQMDAKVDPPYDGLFFCFIRQGLFRWPEFISYYKRKRL